MWSKLMNDSPLNNNINAQKISGPKFKIFLIEIFH